MTHKYSTRRRTRRKKKKVIPFLIPSIAIILLSYLLIGKSEETKVQTKEAPTIQTIHEEALETTKRDIELLRANIDELEKKEQTEEVESELRICRMALKRYESLHRLAKDEEKYKSYYSRKH